MTDDALTGGNATTETATEATTGAATESTTGAEGIFVQVGDDRFLPTEHARGPWDPNALHGGAAAALIARALQRTQPGAELPIARLGFEFLRPIPFAELQVSTEIVRAGRRVQQLAVELTAVSSGDSGTGGPGGSGGDTPGAGKGDQGGPGGAGSQGGGLIGRASALRIQAVPASLPDPDGRIARPGPEPIQALPGPEQGEVIRFALSDLTTKSLATTGMEMSWLTDPTELGPSRVWMRPREPIVSGEPASSLVSLVATADFANGVSRELDFDKYLFINADLTIHLWRAPRGEWIGMDAKTVLINGGAGTSESVLHDTSGPVGRAFQTLVVQPR